MTILSKEPYLKNIDTTEMIRVMGVVQLYWTDLLETKLPNVLLFKNHGAEVAWIDTARKQGYIHV